MGALLYVELRHPIICRDDAAAGSLRGGSDLPSAQALAFLNVCWSWPYVAHDAGMVDFINMVTREYGYRRLMVFMYGAWPCHLAARGSDRYKPPISADPPTKEGSHGARAHVLNH
jgi:hypothetical protein